LTTEHNDVGGAEALGSSPKVVSRRTALAKLGAGAVIAWTAPTVMSITATAAAGSIPCGNYQTFGIPSKSYACRPCSTSGTFRLMEGLGAGQRLFTLAQASNSSLSTSFHLALPGSRSAATSRRRDALWRRATHPVLPAHWWFDVVPSSCAARPDLARRHRGALRGPGRLMKVVQADPDRVGRL
jgi:hypothetical protein